MSETPGVTAKDLLDVLEKKYGSHLMPEFGKVDNVFLRELRDQPGFARRICDAMHFNFYQSKKLRITGFELKVSRADWRRELDHPEKSEAFEPYCHEWYIVAPTGVVVSTELPANWGLYELNVRGKLHATRKAVWKEPLSIPHPLLCSLLRAAAHQPVESLKESIRKQTEQRAERNVSHEVDDLRRELANLKAWRKRFADIVGEHESLLMHSDAKQWGQAVKAVLLYQEQMAAGRADMLWSQQAVDRATKTLQLAREHLHDALQKLDALPRGEAIACRRPDALEQGEAHGYDD